MSMNPEEINFFGYGVYVGDEYPDTAIGTIASFAKSSRAAKNPKIVLDSGKLVWGCECWWGPEDQIKARIAEHGGFVVHCDIDHVRKAYPTGKTERIKQC